MMEHFVEYDRLDEKSRNPGLIEDGVDADQALLGQVGPELKGALSALGTNVFPPRDADVHATSEMPPRQIVDDRPKIVMPSCRTKPALRPPSRDEARTILLDEAIDRRASVGAALAEVIPDGLQDVFIRREKHVVQPDLEATVLWTRRQHGAAVVRDDQPNRLSQPRCQYVTPLRRSVIGSIEIVLPLGNTPLRDRRWLGVKVERKLEHAV